jgi:phosphoglycolate phosphatase-like HAD superfamily hydrolase
MVLTSASKPLLVLFDIDGTLILSGRAGVRGMNAAFHRLYGIQGVLDRIGMAGRTDRAIVIDALNAIDRDPTDAEIALVRDAYCESLASEIVKPVTDPCGVLPGVVAVLDALATRAHIGIGLLTGNFERGAAIKLGHFNLNKRFGFGAFGDDHVNRRDLMPVAFARARDVLPDVPPASRVVIIGDTPLDVDCAKAHGARAVGVATGPFSANDLTAAGADLTLQTLEDVTTFEDWIAELT